jgi:phytoene desaturase
MFYFGFDCKLPGLLHHTLFFHHNYQTHHDALFKNPTWLKKPLYYTASPSKSDPTLAPHNQDLLTALIPAAPGLTDTPKIRSYYQKFILKDLSRQLKFDLHPHLLFSRSYAHNDFMTDYHAFAGNAYGLGQTLFQTAIFRPKIKSSKLDNLYYAGQFTHPGIGLPMVIISGEIVAKYIINKSS